MTRHVLRLIWNRKRTNLLMMAEIFVAFLVLFAVISLGVYTADLWRQPIGFTPDRIWNVAIDMKQTTNDTYLPAQQETVRQVLLALKDFPEIEQSAGTELAPYQLGASESSYIWRGRRIEFGSAEVTDEFKPLLGLTIVEGRWFGPEDRGQNFDPVVINYPMRADLFGNGPVLGENLSPESAPDDAAPPRPKRVVGVVGAYREDGEFDGMKHYVIFRKDLAGTGLRDRPPRNILIRVQPGTTAAFEERLLSRLQAVAPEWSFEVTPMAEMRESRMRLAIVPLLVVALVAGFLMLMVALGVFGVLWQNVTQRFREIGLRRAKGAARVHIRRQILGEIAVMTSLALLAGVLVVIQFPLLNVIYFVEPYVYVLGLVISAAIMYLLTLTCAWYPSRLATRIEPAEALRYE